MPLMEKYTYEQVQLKSRELSTKTFLPSDGMGRGQGKAAPACTSQPGPAIAGGRRAAGAASWLGVWKEQNQPLLSCASPQHRQHFSQRQALAFFLRLYIRTHFKLVKKDSFLALDNDKMPALLLLSCKDHSMWKFDFFFLAK